METRRDVQNRGDLVPYFWCLRLRGELGGRADDEQLSPKKCGLRMNFEPVNGLRLVGIETALLLLVFAFGLVASRYLGRFRWIRWPQWLFANSWRPIIFVVALALIGRAALLPYIGVPQPRINDEYSYLLMADTFSHQRLANPTPPEWQFFETFHVNLQPTYVSKYPVAQGAFQALGEASFHQPWVGVYFSTALLCGAICWALQPFVSLEWAFLAGLLAVFRFALFSYWMNSYWGGSVPALGGALSLGGAVRLFEQNRTRRYRIGSATAFGLGLLMLATSRPFEGLAFSVPLLVYFTYHAISTSLEDRRTAFASVCPVLVIGIVSLGFMAYYNVRTTGNPTLLPYVLNERTYSPLPSLMLQKPRTDIVFTDPVFAKYYTVEAAEHGYEEGRTLAGLAALEARRWGRNWFFYLGPALSFPFLLGFISSAQRPRLRIAVYASLTTLIAVAACNWTQMHYFAAATIAIYLFVVEGMRKLWDEEGRGGQAFVIAVLITVAVTSVAQLNGSTAKEDFHFPDQRRAVIEQLMREPGRQLVLVSYDLDKHYPGNELVHNSADFETQKILWARSKGFERDRELCQSYSDRTFWSAFSDDMHLSLRPLDLCHALPQAVAIGK